MNCNKRAKNSCSVRKKGKDEEKILTASPWSMNQRSTKEIESKEDEVKEN